MRKKRGFKGGGLSGLENLVSFDSRPASKDRNAFAGEREWCAGRRQSVWTQPEIFSGCFPIWSSQQSAPDARDRTLGAIFEFHDFSSMVIDDGTNVVPSLNLSQLQSLCQVSAMWPELSKYWEVGPGSHAWQRAPWKVIFSIHCGWLSKFCPFGSLLLKISVDPTVPAQLPCFAWASLSSFLLLATWRTNSKKSIWPQLTERWKWKSIPGLCSTAFLETRLKNTCLIREEDLITMR